MRALLGWIPAVVTVAVSLGGVFAAEPSPGPGPATAGVPPPIVIRGDEQAHLNLLLPDGGLKPVVGVSNIQVFRANRYRPELADGDGWTFAHHQDLAVWKGRLYAAWAMTPKDEDIPPYKVVYATSGDGFHWSPPADLFPRDRSWSSRFSFYHAANDRMLAFCAGKMSEGRVSEDAKKVLLVREIRADHRLGDVFTLIAPGPGTGFPPQFDAASDAGFVAACREAVANRLLLEQQDYGAFLGERRMAWHADPDLNRTGFWKFGKALCFYHRQDGSLVGLSKMGYATLSDDAGAHWSKPVQPPTLLAGSGKIWGQRTADGRYALAYHPDPAREKRFPLVLVHGDDGREFRDMRVIHGELPPRRYPGKHKSPGAQYMRGLAEWADDGTFPDRNALWVIASVNKEDIWVARVPLPVKPDESAFPRDDFTAMVPGGPVAGWNCYSPTLAPVGLVESAGKCALELRDGDEADYARAIRVFPASAQVQVELTVTPAQTSARLEIDLCDAVGRRPVRVVLGETGHIWASDGTRMADLGAYGAGEAVALVLAVDAPAGTCRFQVNGGPERVLPVAEIDAKAVERISLRTGGWRGLPAVTNAEPMADQPLAIPAVFRVQRLAMTGGR